MNWNDFSKVMFLNFILAMVLTVMLCFALATIKIQDFAYVGVLLGLYVFAGYGVNRLIDDEIIPNNHYRFITAIICIIIYDLAFIYLVPLILGPDFFAASHSLASWGYDGMWSDFVLNRDSYLIICDVIVLIANFFSYR